MLLLGVLLGDLVRLEDRVLVAEVNLEISSYNVTLAFMKELSLVVK